MSQCRGNAEQRSSEFGLSTKYTRADADVTQRQEAVHPRTIPQSDVGNSWRANSRGGRHYGNFLNNVDPRRGAVTWLHTPQKDSISQHQNSLACNDTPSLRPSIGPSLVAPRRCLGVLRSLDFRRFGIPIESYLRSKAI